jgi:CheY-like chemotaxis protein
MEGQARILVVEDEPDLGAVLRVALERSGYEVALAANARDAFERVASPPAPSAILLDLALPDMGGDEFLRTVREDPRLEQIPVVVMSEWARHIDPPFAIAAWLPKPFELRDLLGILDRVAPARGAEAAL